MDRTSKIKLSRVRCGGVIRPSDGQWRGGFMCYIQDNARHFTLNYRDLFMVPVILNEFVFN